MIIIESQAEIRLIQTLESIKAAPNNRRCLWLGLSTLQSGVTPAELAACLTQISRHINGDDCQLYQLFNTDICILSKSLDRDQQSLIHDALSRTLDRPLPETLVRLHELALDWGKIAVMAENVLQAKRAIAQRQQQEMQRRMREEILNFTVPANIADRMLQQRRNRSQLEVMVVEDDAFSRQIVYNSLHKLYGTSSAPDGKTALANYVQKSPDVLFLDIDLPDITGHEVLQKIMSFDPKAYIVMLSGNGDRDNVLRAIQSGAKGFVSKPFAKERLIQYIERCPAHRPNRQPA